MQNNQNDIPIPLSSQHFTISSGALTYFGGGAIRQLPTAVAPLGPRMALLVTDPGLVAAGLAAAVTDLLREADVETTLFDAIHPNPDTEALESGRRAARDSGATVVVALGGGSVLDAAKGIALMAVNEGPARNFDYRNEPAHPGLPVIAIPTTAGTGSETNGFGVIDDPEAKRKFYIGHQSVVPRTVILDPGLTLGLPPDATASSGVDVLAHALESLSSRRNNLFADALDVQATRMVLEYLRRAVGNGGDAEARAQLLLAAHMAGIAFATTGLGLAHAVAHAISARTGALHGAALAALLPQVLSFNLPVRAETYARAWRAVGPTPPVGDDTASANSLIDAVRRAVVDTGLPTHLRDLGCTEAMIPTLIESALADEVIANTPRLPTPAELRTLLEAAL